MEKYLLVGLVLKDESDIDKITEIERVYFNLDKSLRFDRLLFRVTHFRVLELSSLSLLDISINEYCTGNFNIAGVSKGVKEYYNSLSEECENIKSIKLNSCCDTEYHSTDDDYDEYDETGSSEIYMYSNNVPIIYDNAPVYYDSSIVELSDHYDSGYYRVVRLYVNYITGEISVYLDNLLILGDEVDRESAYSIQSKWEWFNRKVNNNFEHLGALLKLGYTLEGDYINKDDTAILFDIASDIVVPNNINKMFICLRGYNYSNVKCNIVLPPNIELETDYYFEFDDDHNNEIKLILSRKLSVYNLVKIATALGVKNYGLDDRERISERVKDSIGVDIEFY